MKLLQTEILLFYEIAKLYEKYKVVLELISIRYGNNGKSNYYLKCNNEFILKTFPFNKETLLKILQDKNDGLYSDKYNQILRKIESIATAKIPLQVQI